MCLGVPMQILECDGIAARATDGTREELIDLSLTGWVAPGTWVLTFLGAAREVISEAEALKISDALDGLRSLMAGGGLGDAFADLEARPPSLPPHLQAALDAGRKTA
ncbi:HypC/HybG/HupF family hydrogenase formation chaperone [Mangrovicoccus ximenensis]|uniref:HypC/HybG/HupF family hydrogenase formation chaperone n=1 Tax=Mangrovicoccus ximenensis TaxID=1911570 RepID=UPI000D340FEA|nr:HypC/HybG/HupF family hydrogenase formation chaperone [Mangrovicoccus ximenensis]